MSHSRSGSPSAKEPAVVTAEKLLAVVRNNDCAAVNAVLDPTIVFQSPMGVYAGRPYVKPWLEFEGAMMEPFQQFVRHHGTFADDALKIGRLQWSVGGLHVTDIVTQTQLLTIRSIKRTIRRESKTQQDHDIAEALLLAWTGPYFSKFCASKGRALDNRAIVLPVLDYGFQGLGNVRNLLTHEPVDGRPIGEDHVVFHFMKSALECEKALEGSGKANADSAAAAASASADQKQQFGSSAQQRRGTTITIQAKSRTGETNAIIIDKAALEGKGEGSKLEALEDADFQVKRDRTRYVCSGIRLGNNAFTQAKELESVIRIYLVNAFYFLTLVDLSSNKLTEIPELTQLLSLQTLYLHDNQVAEWKELEKLQRLPQLQTLSLFGNPIQQTSDSARTYKFCVLYYFYSATGFRVFAARQQTLHHAAVTAASYASRPNSRIDKRPTSPPLQSGVPRAPTPAHMPYIGADPKCSGGERLAKFSVSTTSPTLVKLRLRQLDHSVLSTLEVETLEQFLPVIRRKLKRACSPTRSNSPQPAGAAHPLPKVASAQ